MRQPNIVVIAVDTLRRDHLGCYGYGRPTSPNIDRLAAEGLTFDHAYANHFPTQPSFTTLYTGLDGIDHNIVRQGRGPILSPRIPLLAERLHAAGYVTAAVDSLVTLRHGLPGWYSRGYDYYIGFRYDPDEREQATYIADRALALIEHLKNERFFLLVHYWDPHIPYWPPEKSHVFKLDPSPADRPPLVEEFAKQGDLATSLLLRTMKMNQVSNYDWVVSQYDEGIWNADQEIGRILDLLDKNNLTRDTLVVFLSDHGECFGEFGVHFDHAGPADANMRVPLIMRLPGEIPAGKRNDSQVCTLDITTTLLEMAGARRSERMLGRGLLGGFREVPFVVSAEATRQCSWILRTPEWKLVLPAVNPETGQPYADVIGRPRGGPTLHDMRDPAREEADVTSAHPEVAARLAGELRGWLDARCEGKLDPLSAQGPSIPWERQVQFWQAHIRRYEGNKDHKQAYGSLSDRFGLGDPSKPEFH